MAIDRYLLICKTKSAQLCRKSWSLLVIVISIWMSSVLVVSPLIVYTKTIGNGKQQQCALSFPDAVGHVIKEETSNPKIVNASQPNFDLMSKPALKWPLTNALNLKPTDRNGAQSIFKCQHNSSSIFRHYLYSAFIIGFVIPVGIITYCYSKIVYTMNAVHRRAQAHQGDVRKPVNSNTSRDTCDIIVVGA